LPPYISDYSFGGGAQAYVWESNSADQRFPQDPANRSGQRNSTTVFDDNDWFFTLTLNQPKTFQLGVYALDYENAQRSVTLRVNGDSQVINGNLAGGGNDNYHQGQWVLWNLTLPADTQTVDVIKNANSLQNVTISAITFNPVPEPASLMLLALGGLGGIRVGRRRI
jgi:hypothetical protein